jgi:hypothetical protein
MAVHPILTIISQIGDHSGVPTIKSTINNLKQSDHVHLEEKIEGLINNFLKEVNLQLGGLISSG